MNSFGVIDGAIERLLSRKFMAWLVATIALFAGKLSGMEWVYVTSIYIIAQGYIDTKTLVKEYFKK
jgi:hypothetical protein